MAHLSFPAADKKVLALFDVDNTLSKARKLATPEMLDLLKSLRKKIVIGFVGGSDLSKIVEQLGPTALQDWDFGFAENGLTAYRLGQQLESESFISWLGEEKFKELANFCLHYIADLDIPKKRGTFIEYRNGMINVSPIGRNCSYEERLEFNAYDNEHHIREKFVDALRQKFPDSGLAFAIGGQISFDVFPIGWDKTYCLQRVEKEGFEKIHFFGDKTYKGGNDYEIFSDERTIGHSVANPEDTLKQLRDLFF